MATPGPALPAASPTSCTSLSHATHSPLLSFPNFSHHKQGRKGDVAGGKADRDTAGAVVPECCTQQMEGETFSFQCTGQYGLLRPNRKVSTPNKCASGEKP